MVDEYLQSASRAPKTSEERRIAHRKGPGNGEETTEEEDKDKSVVSQPYMLPSSSRATAAGPESKDLPMLSPLKSMTKHPQPTSERIRQ